MRKTIPLIAALICLILVSAASAQDVWRPQGYVGFFAGYSFPNQLESDDDRRDYDLDGALVVGAKLGGLFHNRILALEAEFYHIGEMDAERSVGGIKSENLFLNAILRYPERTIHPFIGAGLGWSWLEWEGAPFVLRSKDSDDTWAAQFLLGIDFDLNRNVSVELGYRYIYSEPSFGKDYDAEFSSHLFTAGFIFRY